MVTPAVCAVPPGYGLCQRSDKQRFKVITKKPSEAQIREEISLFRQQQQSLILATTDAHGCPLCSTAPFIETQNGELVLLLSDMAEHSRNLHYHEQTHTPVAIMFIEDEADCRNIFARKRLSYQGLVTIINKEQAQWPPMIAQLQQKFGKTIELLSSLADFRLYVITPQKGNYVKGFGQAWSLNKDGLPILNN